MPCPPVLPMQLYMLHIELLLPTDEWIWPFSVTNRVENVVLMPEAQQLKPGHVNHLWTLESLRPVSVHA